MVTCVMPFPALFSKWECYLSLGAPWAQMRTVLFSGSRLLLQMEMLALSKEMGNKVLEALESPRKRLRFRGEG